MAWQPTARCRAGTPADRQGRQPVGHDVGSSLEVGSIQWTSGKPSEQVSGAVMFEPPTSARMSFHGRCGPALSARESESNSVSNVIVDVPAKDSSSLPFLTAPSSWSSRRRARAGAMKGQYRVVLKMRHVVTQPGRSPRSRS